MALTGELDAMDQRILGSLLEKQVTVPASYPLSANALRSACNQASSREPVTAYEERDLEARLRDLRERGLVRVVWAGRGSRTLKYHQLLDELVELTAAERALLTVLLLRGPQAPGELRTRTERLHGFADRSGVEQVLEAMAGRPEPLVRELGRRRGQQDARWVHLLGPVEGPGDVASGSGEMVGGADREVVITEGGDARDRRVRTTYDTVATTYADRLADELDQKPFDRWLLGRVAAAADGPVLEAGCGPGHVAAHLTEYTFQPVRGIDLSPGMVEEARRRFPDVEVEVGDLTRPLRPRDAPAWSAVVAWYSLVHLAASELPGAVAALAHVLAPGGTLALALHLGEEVRHIDDWWDHAVEVDFVLHDRSAVLAAVSAAGLVDVEWYVRSPVPEVEVETERLYVLARRPG